MSPKAEQFIREYLIDLNATQAAVRAGYSAKTAYSQGQRLLKDVEANAAIELAMEKRAHRTEITADRVLVELAKIGFSDLRKAVIWRANITGMVEDEDGSQRLAVTNEVQLINSEDLDDATAAAISEVGQDSRGALKIKLHDKQGALVSIGRHLGMFKDKTEISGPNGGPVEARLVDAPPNETREQWLARKKLELEG